jgi:putative aldouronate transport system substrate-binding protein
MKEEVEMSRRLVCTIIVIAICISFSACAITEQAGTTRDAAQTTPQATQQQSSTPEDNKIFAKDTVTISMLFPNHVSWPYKEDWFVKKAVEEATNVKLDVILIEDEKCAEKFNLLVAAGSVPDIVTQYTIAGSNQYALQGAFINVENYLDKMPNFKKYLEKNEDVAGPLRASDGNLYAFPGNGQGCGNRRVWIYRKDIFDENGFVPPTTPEELYDVCKKLKEIYPESYPFATRMGIELMLPSWGSYWSLYPYYDFDKNIFKYGPVEEGYKDMLVYMNKLVNDKLTPPDLYSINTKAWVDLMVQNKAFITTDYVGRIDSVTLSGKEVTPEFQLAYMSPVNKVAGFTGVDISNYIVSSKSKKIDDAVKLIDWYYTDEAKELLSWGKEGETYVTIDGKRQFIMSDYAKEYGITATGWGLIIDSNAVMSSYSQYAQQATNDMPQYEMRYNPAEYMQLTEAENEVYMTVGADLKKFAQEQEAQFILGQKSFSEWDAYVKEIESKGLSRLLDMYTKAYERYK